MFKICRWRSLVKVMSTNTHFTLLTTDQALSIQWWMAFLLIFLFFCSANTMKYEWRYDIILYKTDVIDIVYMPCSLTSQSCFTVVLIVILMLLEQRWWVHKSLLHQTRIYCACCISTTRMVQPFISELVFGEGGQLQTPPERQQSSHCKLLL